MIYASAITVPASTTVGVFSELGISPGRYQVHLQGQIWGGSGVGWVNFLLAQDSAGTSAGPVIPFTSAPAGGPASPVMYLEFVTDRDEVYVKNPSASDGTLNIALTAV